MGDLQRVLGTHFFGDINRHADRTTIRNAKNIQLDPDQFAIFALQPLCQLVVLACTLLKLLEECSVDLPINRRSDIQRRKFSELIAIWKRVACWLRISGIDGHAGPLFGRLAPSSQRLTRSSSACSESIAENLTISYPNIVGEFVDL